jgi:molybdate transport system substrate-binding protein
MRTDAAISDKVKIVGVFPEDCHPPVIYRSQWSKNRLAAKQFITFMKIRKIGRDFSQYGFQHRADGFFSAMTPLEWEAFSS